MGKRVLAGILLGGVLFSGLSLGRFDQERFSFTLKGGIHIPAGDRFSTVYKSLINMGFSFDLRLIPVLSLWIQADYISGRGELTVSNDPVELLMIPGTVGIKALFPTGRSIFYAGVGGCYVYYRENSDTAGINSHRSSQPGYAVTAGIRHSMGRLLLLAGVEYRGLKIPAEYDATVKIDAGGFSLNLGAGIRF